jgi:uncharacterized membrane protein
VKPQAAPASRPPRRAAATWTDRLDRVCERIARPALAIMIVAWVVVYSARAADKYRHYLYSDIDLAMFVQAVDGVLHGTLFSSIRGMHWLGDHASLILFPIVPIYAVFRHPVTLPVLQSIALALGALPVWALTRRELGGGFLPLLFAALYLLYPALGYTALYEFHPEVLVTSALLAAFACHRAQRTAWTWAFAGIALLAKEDIALPVAALGVVALLDRKVSRRREALGLFALAALSLIVSFAVLKPAFGSAAVDYGRIYVNWGETPGAVAMNVLRNPLRALEALFVTPEYAFDSVIKLQYYLHLLAPLLFLPLASPFTLLIALPTVATHMLSWRSAQHTIFYQYTATVTPFVVAAAVVGLRNLAARARGTAARPARVYVLAMLALGATVGTNWLFGPLTGHGRWQLVGAEEAIAPAGKDRALTRYRDPMVAALAGRDSIMAGFEFLGRFADRRNTRSLHNVVGGFHTFSTLPYPIPGDVSAVLADVSHSRLRPYGDRGTRARLVELMTRNRLALTAAAGDVLMFLRDAPDSLRVWEEGETAVPEPARVVFDRQLAFLGAGWTVRSVAPGGLLPIRTFWRRVAPTDSLYVLQLTAYDAMERAAFTHMRYLGYLLHPAGSWTDTTMVSESYRLVIPDDLRSGTYMLGMRVGRRDQLDQVLCDTDDAKIRAQNMVVELGRFTVVGGR